MKLLQLQKKYPKAFEKFIRTKPYREYFNRSRNTSIFELDVRELWKLITDFMDEQGTIIEIRLIMYLSGDNLRYEYIIKKTNDKNTDFYEVDCDILKSRKQAETKAIEKAFEILEGRL